MSPKLKDNIEQLYGLFSKYPGNPHMPGSPNYTDLEKWNKQLFSKPLRQLSADDLSRYAGKAITTWGDANDLKHFLPRLLELTAQLQTPYDIWILFDRIRLAGWKTWPADEQQAIKEYMLLLWDNLLSTDNEKAEWEFTDYFAALANFYPDFEALLYIWDENNSRAATKHLAMYIYEENEDLFQKQMIYGFEKKNEHVPRFVEWLLSESVTSRLQQAFDTWSEEDFAETISVAEQILNNEKMNRSL